MNPSELLSEISSLDLSRSFSVYYNLKYQQFFIESVNTRTFVRLCKCQVTP